MSEARLREANVRGARCISRASFQWTSLAGGRCELTGDWHDGEKPSDVAELRRHAATMGWQPPRWWKPWTWDNTPEPAPTA